MDRVDKVAQIAAEPVELPHNESVSSAEGLQASSQSDAVIVLTRSRVAVHVVLGYARRQQRVTL
jgi:hypothetical protein